LQRLFFDQGLPGGVGTATALAALGLEANGVGGVGAPPNGSSDDENWRWCAENGAILVTHDKGKKDKEIIKVLDQHKVGVILVLKDLRSMPAYHLVRALLNAEGKMDQIATGKKRLRHTLKASGRLAPRS
jgi:hypothetical protein